MEDKEFEGFVDNTIKENSKFFSWIQTFTKKIVTVTFILFVIFQIFILIMIYLEYRNGELKFLDTFITESNETFRIVIGGYIIKAACENAIKIGSSIIAKFLNRKCNLEDNIEENSEEE